MPLTRKVVSAFAVACLLALGGCGDDASNTGTTAPPPPGNGADRAFVNSVLALHEKSVALAVIGQKRGDEFVRRISREVAGTHPPETARLRSIGSALFSAGVPIGTLGVPATDAADVDLGALRRSAHFNQAFLEAMIPIHEQTIALSRAEIVKGSQVDLKTTAQAMIDAEQTQLASMRKRLKS